MVKNDLYQGDRQTTWCPGCGNFPIRKAVVKALTEMGLMPEEVVLISGIGQAAKMPHYLRINGYNGLHGRALPPAIGARVGNSKIKIIVESGDGDTYGEGGNHFIHNIRRNPDILHLVHNNQIYGLTKGQASPTSEKEFQSVIQPHGVTSKPFRPLRVALGVGASFVARAFAGDINHLAELIKAGLNHRGYALIDILQPCVTFNKFNTYQWYRERVYKLGDGYDPTDYSHAMQKANEWGDQIPVGILYQSKMPTFLDHFPQVGEDPLIEREEQTPSNLKFLLNAFR